MGMIEVDKKQLGNPPRPRRNGMYFEVPPSLSLYGSEDNQNNYEKKEQQLIQTSKKVQDESFYYSRKMYQWKLTKNQKRARQQSIVRNNSGSPPHKKQKVSFKQWFKEQTSYDNKQDFQKSHSNFVLYMIEYLSKRFESSKI